MTENWGEMDKINGEKESKTPYRRLFSRFSTIIRYFE